MPRLARVVIPDQPHHITQKGARSQNIFFSADDKLLYIKIVQEELDKTKAEIWAYCLMDNHVHFVVVPRHIDDLSKIFREAHKRYARTINYRQGWRGHLWQERFHSFVMSDSHLRSAIRYVENNPVEANMVKKAEEYPWSSARAHVLKEEDPLLSQFFLNDEIDDWAGYLLQEEVFYRRLFDKHEKTGRPLGDSDFVQGIEKLTKINLRKNQPGRKLSINK